MRLCAAGGFTGRISDEQKVQTLFAGCFGYSDDGVWYLPGFYI